MNSKVHDKKILILVSKVGPKSEYIVSYLRTKLGTAKIDLAEFRELFIDVDGMKAEIFLNGPNNKLSDYGFVYFRGVDENSYSFAGSVALYLDRYEIDYADKTYQNMGPSGDKFTSLLKLSFAGLPILHTVFCMRDIIDKSTGNIIARLGLPMIAKEFVSQHGEGIRVIRNKNDFVTLLTEASQKRIKQFLFQKYIEIDKEYRFLVMGEEVRSVQRMYRDTSKFRLAIDMERKEEFLPVGDFSEEMKNIAVKAAKVLNIQVAGVDLAIEKGTGKIFLFEVNRGPGFTYDTKISPEIPELARFISRKVKNML
jgi:glutathione synthase/RimK-type ligase-like ATP-grasp enzyme